MIVLDKNQYYCYKYFRLCNECKQYNIYDTWCQFCNNKHFGQNFKNWTSGNCDLDKFILNTQIKTKEERGNFLEWIEYKMIKNIDYLIENESEIIYSAIWKDGPINNWDSKSNQWNRTDKNIPVILKCIHKSHNITKYLKGVCIFFNKIKIS